jgi:DNA-binding TFAR19-related protein (PDSD5 family)
MTPDPIRRVRQLALQAMIDAGGRARLAQVERVGLAQPAAAAAGEQTLLQAYCGRVGKPIPARYLRR